jgi:hypothetical protein
MVIDHFAVGAIAAAATAIEGIFLTEAGLVAVMAVDMTIHGYDHRWSIIGGHMYC